MSAEQAENAVNQTSDPKDEQSEGVRKRPLKGFVIAGASLAVLFSIAYWKGRADYDE